MLACTEDRTLPPWNYYCGPTTVTVITGDELDTRELHEPCVDDMGPGTVYLEKFEPTPNDPELLKAGIERNQVSKVTQQFGTWVVTTYGMECLTWYYPIISGRLGKDEPFGGWQEHMRRKGWVNVADFGACYKAALKYHKDNTPEPRPTTSISNAQLMRDISFRPKRSVRPAREVGPRKEHRIGWQRQRFLILRRDGYRCQICGRDASDGVRLHIDHKIPKAKDGTTDELNLWVLCTECNLGKGTLDL